MRCEPFRDAWYQQHRYTCPQANPLIAIKSICGPWSPNLTFDHLGKLLILLDLHHRRPSTCAHKTSQIGLKAGSATHHDTHHVLMHECLCAMDAETAGLRQHCQDATWIMPHLWRTCAPAQAWCCAAASALRLRLTPMAAATGRRCAAWLLECERARAAAEVPGAFTAAKCSWCGAKINNSCVVPTRFMNAACFCHNIEAHCQATRTQ